jgi:hypothetical protein
MIIIVACGALALGYMFGTIHNYPNGKKSEKLNAEIVDNIMLKERNKAMAKRDEALAENARLIVESVVMGNELKAIDGPSGFGNCMALQGLTLVGKAGKCVRTIRELHSILRDYPKGQDDGTWIKRVDEALKC